MDAVPGAPRDGVNGPTVDVEEVAPHIDALRQDAREAFLKRDVKAFMKCYASDFEYVQPDGRVLTRKQFEHGVAKQMRDLTSVDAMSSQLEERHVEGVEIVEQVRTESRATMVAFMVIVRKLRVERVQINRWVRTQAGWKIRRVEVLHEDRTVNGRRETE